MKFFNQLLCRHIFRLIAYQYKNDTDFSGFWFEVYKCSICDKLVGGGRLSKNEEEKLESSGKTIGTRTIEL